MRIGKIAPALVLALAAATTTACGGGDTSSGVPKELVYWASNQGTSLDNDKAVLQPELDKFEKASGIKVKLEVVPWTDLLNRILAATTSGKGPDVLNIGNTWSASLQSTGAFLPFDDAALEKVGGKSRFLGPSLAATGASGQPPVGVPLYGQAYGLYYNKKLFSEAGIAKPPATWEELVEDGKKLTKPDKGQWGLSLQAGQVTENSHHAAILGAQQGAQFFTPDGKPQLASDRSVAAVRQFVDLMQKDKIVNPSNAEYADTAKSLKDLSDGKAAMFMNQASAGSFKNIGMDMANLGVAPIPLPAAAPPNGRKVTSFVAGINMSVFKNTKNPDAALDFVKFMVSAPEQALLNKTYGSLPTVQDAYSDAAFQTEDVKVFQSVLANSAEPMPQVPQESQFETLIGTAMKTMFADVAAGKPVDDAKIRDQLNQADQQIAAGS
ncbi:ABC transporter substrate-binding protein [Amycolatopsis regifaucium]|uniref:Sugar ABC transporter substrate-binding protein n=1 Tax=Amycolatopsis regifaucium TaxID=546365 RepID=A0A154MP72_9PSEU|nr:sugar ABC transporter substrate-binding protein [Amycolatopsis regifaucium]KZB86101.1 sugar ABC transporter substrate-binding protein [Amycolatopsis regifaucium]OKA04994.1 sugar ABC transporter substrate-binding protein [Amycolatopsis regifaucium]SFH77912.1 carbohydrate ABC transporter substrate-binding protein, CUT1 family [Amycolatopsis regifaucium]